MITAGRPTVLVSGVGAPPGVSILKALRQSELQPRVVATDADPASVGLFRADVAAVLPHIRHDPDGYLAALEDLVHREAISLVCLSSEMELRHVAPHAAEMEVRTGARIVVNAAAAVETFMDKWLTAEALRRAGLPVPRTVLASDRAAVEALVEAVGFPLLVKPRRGSGSKGVVKVTGPAEMEFFRTYIPEAVVQEYLEPDDQEYTVGLYRSARLGFVGQIVMRRTMSAGLTYKATVTTDRAIEGVCQAIADHFDLVGPVNIQLRRTVDGPKVFEVNLRFSSTAVMRAHFGFNEPEMCLRDMVLGERLGTPLITTGRAFRYWDEVYVDGPEMVDSDDPWPRGLIVQDI